MAEAMEITDTELINELEKLGDAFDLDHDLVATEILRNFFRPKYKYSLMNDFRSHLGLLE